MDKATFESRLIEATQRVLAFTPEFVINELPPECRYFIYPNSSYDEGYGPIGRDEERFPEDSKLGRIGPVEVSQVVNFLWRSGRVPQWIDVNAHSADNNFTYIRLICCGRYMGYSRKLYHEKIGIPPFQPLGPHLPPSWIETQTKFDLNDYKDE